MSLDEDEPPLRPAASSSDAPGDTDEPHAPTRVVENIVLEGDGVSQSQAEVPDKPMDELDQFTRQLSRASAEAEPPATRDSIARTAAARAAAARLAPARRGAAGARPGETAAARDRRASAQASSAAPGSRSARGGHETRAPQAQPSPGLDEISFEGDAALDDASLDDPLLDEPLPAEAIEPLQDAPGSANLDIPALEASPYRWAWIAGSAALALLLVLQMAAHWREQLALSPTWGGMVRAVSAALGAPIAPHWDLTAYEVRQQGAQSEPGHRAQILVRFSLANHAARAQPVPLLRLTLLDRYGRRVAQRDLTPTDYWPQGRAPAAFLNSDERIDTEVQVRDPSADSASFELDVCLREAGGLLHCAGDTNAGSAGAAAGPDSAP